MAHNNFVMHFENKMYRLRETGLYPFDFDGEYSSLTAKYLVLEHYPGRQSARLARRHPKRSSAGALH